ncbi:hypothetical protein CYMTET_19756 [Cymbomonas tetramitiformis]|uniref:Uncharacterized protein n=1 Tax=Cymbomonas tetramitiformis TaxID=36881 RepID=A0AAE0G5H5_9CHLO|nr:hypothetical protein CYMTET_19756 [Cymbomonas tetramitiformis]
MSPTKDFQAEVSYDRVCCSGLFILGELPPMRLATPLVTMAWLSLLHVPLGFSTTLEQTSAYQECAASPTTCTNMQLEHNSLTGTLPTELGELTVMNEMQLQHNSLTGSLPTELGELTMMNEM